MADYWVYHGATGAADGSSWANAYTSLAAAQTAGRLASENRIFIADDHVDPVTGAAKTHAGPTSGLPVLIISADRSDTGAVPAYKAGTTAQLNTTDGAYDLTIDGSFALYGVRLATGRHFLVSPDSDERQLYYSCKFVMSANGRFSNLGATSARTGLVKCNIDLTADGTTPRTTSVFESVSGEVYIQGLTFTNAGYRTGRIFEQASIAKITISGCDFSGFTNATACEIVRYYNVDTLVSNCIMPATFTLAEAAAANTNPTGVMATNCLSADTPLGLRYENLAGIVEASAAAYRTGGATVEGDACSWLVTTRASNTTEDCPFYLPWIYGTVSSTGSKAFDLYITNDTADFTDAEVWLEVEYLSTDDEAIWALATDQRATITATAAAQTDDTTSTWSGTGPSFTYKQKLSVTATVNETGQYRARVAVGVASIAGSRYFYVDPKVSVT